MMYVYQFNFYNDAGIFLLQVGSEAENVIEAMQTFVLPKDDVLSTAGAIRVEVVQSIKVWR